MEAVESCPVHSDLFEGAVSTRYIGGRGEKRVYIYLVIDFGALERTVSFVLCCTRRCPFLPWHSLSPTSYSAHRPCITASAALAAAISKKRDSLFAGSFSQAIQPGRSTVECVQIRVNFYRRSAPDLTARNNLRRTILHLIVLRVGFELILRSLS